MLPDFGWTELLVIAIVLIVVVGPQDLPKVLRGFSKSLGSMRKMAGDFRKQFDDALKDAELDDLRNVARDLKSMDPRSSIKDALMPLGKLGDDLNDEVRKAAGDIEGSSKPKSAASAALDGAGDKAREAQAEAAAKRKAQAEEANTFAANYKPPVKTDPEPSDAAEKAAPTKKAAAKPKSADKAPAKAAAAKTVTKAAPKAKPAAPKTAADKPAAKKPAAKAVKPKGDA